MLRIEGAPRGHSALVAAAVHVVNLIPVVVVVMVVQLPSGTHQAEQRNHGDELLPEALVEPSVEERVVAGGGHGQGVATEEDQVVELPAIRLDHPQIRDEVDGVQRQPTNAEHQAHENEHPVGAAIPLPLVLFRLGRSARSVGAALPPAALQPPHHGRIAKDDRAKRQHELRQVGERAVGGSRRRIGPILHAVGGRGGVARGGADLHVVGVGGRDSAGERVDDQDDQHAGLRPHPRPEREHDHHEPVHGDDGQGQRGDVDRDAQREREQRAQSAAEIPLAGEGVDGRDGNGEQAHHHVRKSQVQDK